MALDFRQRIFVVLVALTAVPTALAVVGWALAVRTVGPSAGARVALEEMAASGRGKLAHMGTTRPPPPPGGAPRPRPPPAPPPGGPAGPAPARLRRPPGRVGA